jgi:hypothetical protein
VNGGHGAELAQLGKNGRLAEVARVDDQVGVMQDLDAGVGEAPITAWQMGIGNYPELQRSSCSDWARFSSMRSR